MPRLEFVVDPRWGFRSIQARHFVPMPMLTAFVSRARPFASARSRSLSSATVQPPLLVLEVCDQHARDRLPYTIQSHISCPEANAGRSTVRSTRTSFSPASVSLWRKTSGSDT